MMEIRICQNPEEIGRSSARWISYLINKYIENNGTTRILLSTGASQFETLEALRQEKVDWSKVEMFHLDEYVGLEENHKASFRKYLRDRFVNYLNLKKFYPTDGKIESIPFLNREISKKQIDIGLIGIGENAHIAFNDPPADFECDEPYKVVKLSDTCKIQQVREGWFDTIDEVPSHAVSITVKQILKCKEIVSCVPHNVKAKAVYDTITKNTTPLVPATILKEHKNFVLYLDRKSARLIIKY